VISFFAFEGPSAAIFDLSKIHYLKVLSTKT